MAGAAGAVMVVWWVSEPTFPPHDLDGPDPQLQVAACSDHLVRKEVHPRPSFSIWPGKTRDMSPLMMASF